MLQPLHPGVLLRPTMVSHASGLRLHHQAVPRHMVLSEIDLFSSLSVVEDDAPYNPL